MAKFKVGDEVVVLEAVYGLKVGEYKTIEKGSNDDFALIKCSCCPHPGVTFWCEDKYFELVVRKTLSECLGDHNEMFKFLKRELDTSN